MTEEIWIPVIRFEGLYEVSNLGRVRSLTRPNKLEGLVSQRVKTGDYLNIHLCKKGKGKEYRVHRIVLESFKGPSLEGNTQVNHKDGNKHNNCLDNLEWSNPVDNALHRSRVLFKNIGEQHGLSKLTEGQVLEIVRLTKMGASQRYLSKLNAVSKHTIYCVLKGKTWNWLTGINTNG